MLIIIIVIILIIINIKIKRGTHKSRKIKFSGLGRQ
jgi:hypothetical protein